MTSVELLDSKRFCAFMDEGAASWAKSTDEQRAKMLDDLASWLGGVQPKSVVPRETIPQPMPVYEQPKRKGGRPKGSKNAPKPEPENVDRAALKAEHTRPLTEAEKRETLAQLAKEKPARDPQLIVNDAVLEVIVPNWAKTPVSPDGHRHFIVNAERKQERVSFELDKWKAALSLHKLPAGSVVFKPEGLGMSPGSLETGRAGNAWRVMIG